MDFIALAKEWGIPLAFVAFFIWRDWKREDRLWQKYDQITSYQKDKLETLIETATKAIVEFTTATNQLTFELRKRPCLQHMLDHKENG